MATNTVLEGVARDKILIHTILHQMGIDNACTWSVKYFGEGEKSRGGRG